MTQVTEVKLFGKWTFNDVLVNDISLQVFLVYLSRITSAQKHHNFYHILQEDSIKRDSEKHLALL